MLLVDDHLPNLIALDAVLHPCGYRLVKATTGEDALTRARTEDFAVILLDVRMPGMDGFEVATRLKQEARTRYLPIIFVTAVATEVQHAARAYSVGAVDYLIKPLDPDVVRGKVATFVELQRQGRALREAERREHELRIAELRVASDKRYRKLVEGIDHVIAWSGDPSTLRLSFLSRQAARVFGVGPERITDPEFWSRHLHPDDHDQFRAAVVKTFTEGVDQACNHRMRTPDGRTLWFHTGLSLDLDDSMPELHGVSADVTDLKHAEEQARHATRAREELLAIVSHDLKTPLQAIAMTVARLSNITTLSADTTGQAKAGIALIHRAATQMDRLLDDLLDMERIQRKRLVVERRREDAASLVRDGVEMLEPLATQRSIDLLADVSAVESVEVLCERDRVVQVFSNLIGNSLRYSAPGASITVRAAPRRGEVEFSVTDTGRGIPADQLASLFDPDARKTAHSREGLGLGLAIAKGIVEAHGGALRVESDVDHGSTFTFTLPRAALLERAGA